MLILKRILPSLWHGHWNFHDCGRHTGLHPRADLFSHMLGEVSAIPPRPVIVCSAVKCECEQRPGRNMALFKGFSCSTECRLLMSLTQQLSRRLQPSVSVSGWEPALAAQSLSSESEHSPVWCKNAEMACTSLVDSNITYSCMHNAPSGVGEKQLLDEHGNAWSQ